MLLRGPSTMTGVLKPTDDQSTDGPLALVEILEQCSFANSRVQLASAHARRPNPTPRVKTPHGTQPEHGPACCCSRPPIGRAAVPVRMWPYGGPTRVPHSPGCATEWDNGTDQWDKRSEVVIDEWDDGLSILPPSRSSNQHTVTGRLQTAASTSPLRPNWGPADISYLSQRWPQSRHAPAPPPKHGTLTHDLQCGLPRGKRAGNIYKARAPKEKAPRT